MISHDLASPRNLGVLRSRLRSLHCTPPLPPPLRAQPAQPGVSQSVSKYFSNQESVHPPRAVSLLTSRPESNPDPNPEPNPEPNPNPNPDPDPDPDPDPNPDPNPNPSPNPNPDQLRGRAPTLTLTLTLALTLSLSLALTLTLFHSQPRALRHTMSQIVPTH